MIASLRQRNSSSVGLASAVGEAEAQQATDVETPSSTKSTPPRSPPDDRSQQNPRSRCRTGETPIMPPMRSRIRTQRLRAPTSDAGVSSAAAYNSHDAGWNSYTTTRQNVPKPTLSTLVLCEWLKLSGCIGPGGDGGICLNSVFLLAKRISLAVVLGALLMDVYLLKEAIFMEAESVELASSGAARTTSEGFPQHGTLRRRRSPRPRYALPLVAAHHALTNLGLPAESSSTRHGVVKPIKYSVGSNDNLDSGKNKSGEARTSSGGSSHAGAKPVVRSSEHERDTVDAKSKGTHSSEEDEQGQGHEHETKDAFSLLQAGQSLHMPAPGPSDRDTEAVATPALMPVSELYDGQRIAIIVPYIGSELPVWWDAFAKQAGHNEGLVDWIIICDQKLVREGGPPNIKFFPMGTERLSWLLAGVVENQHPDLVQKNGHISPFGDANKHQTRRAMAARVPEREAASTDKTWESLDGDGTRKELERTIEARRRAASFLSKVLVTSPYYVVEFKPALGWLFREYLMEYTHWAYGDLDVLFGDMRRGWLEPNELQDFDIITFSFGDQYRAYLRGQLTIHKNNIAVNRIWTGCDHLTHYTQRLEKFLENRALPLESAEGCYSLAAASDTSLKIKFSVKALSDVDEEGAYNRERQVILDGKGLVTLCPDLGYYYGDSGEHDAGRVSYDAKGLTNGGIQVMQDPVGPVSAVKRYDASGKRCEHWIKSEYQTCVEGVGGSHTLFLIGGQYLRQEFVNTKAATGGRNCRAGAFYHFQDHKVNYRSWNTRPPVPGAHSGIAAGPAGIVPLPVPRWREMAYDPTLRAPPLPTKHEHTYCLEWVERRRVRRPHKGRPELVCIQKVSGSEAVTLVDTRTARSLPRVARHTGTAATATVTLGGVGRPGDLGPFLLTAWEWEGPKIFAMLLASNELAPIEDLLKMGGVAGANGDDVLVVGLVGPPSPQGPLRKHRPAGFPQKALMNLVADLCDSRYLLTLPGPASLSHNAYASILNQLPLHALSKTASRQQVDGPVTLVVPFQFLPYYPSSTGGTTVSTPTVQQYHASRRPPSRDADPTKFASAANTLNWKPLGHDGQMPRAPAPPPPAGGAVRAASAAASASKASQAAAAAGQAAVGAAISAREAAQVVASAGAPGDAAVSAALRAAASATAAGEAAIAAAESSRKAVEAAKTAEASALVAATAATRAEAKIEAAVGREQATLKAAGMQATVQATAEALLVDGNHHNNAAPSAVAAREPSGNPIGRDSADRETTASIEVGDTAKGGGKLVRESSLLLETTEANPSTDTVSIREGKPLSVPAPPNSAAISATDTSDRGDRQGQKKSPNWNLDHGNKSEQNPGTNDEQVVRQSQPKQVSPEQHNREQEMTQGVPVAAVDTLQARRQLGSQLRGPAAAVANAIERRDEWDEEGAEERWLKTLLISGADMVGLVVDLWTPGPLFLRQIEEFGDAGCLDGAYALGLWHAGSSFRVATDVTISPITLPISRQSERDRSGTEEAGSGETYSHFSSAEDTCVPGQGTVKTAAIYSAFLRQVSNVYRHPRSGSTETLFERMSSESETDSGVHGHRNKSYTQSTMARRAGGGKTEGGIRPGLREGERIIKGGRPAIARDPFVFPFSEHPEIFYSDGIADDVLPEIGGGRARKGGWEGAWEDYFPS